MASGVELPQVARHAVWRGRDLRQVHRRDDGQQVPDPRLRRRRDRARPAGARRRAERHRRDGPLRRHLLCRQGSDPRLRYCSAVRHQRAPAGGMDQVGRRTRAAERSLQGLQHLQPAVRQYRRPDGRLVPQGDQGRRRPQGPEVPHRRHRGPGVQQAGRGGPADRRRRHLSGAGEGHDRRRRMGRSLRRPEARLQQDRAVLLLSRLVGRRAADHGHDQPQQVERAAQDLQGRYRGGIRLRADVDGVEVRCRESQGAARACGRAAPS